MLKPDGVRWKVEGEEHEVAGVAHARHDIYKWQHDHRAGPKRSASFSHVPLDRSATLDPTLAHIKEPGGFRRNFVVNRAQEQGLEAPPIVRNVIDFLFLYGHFVSSIMTLSSCVTHPRPEKTWTKMTMTMMTTRTSDSFPPRRPKRTGPTALNRSTRTAWVDRSIVERRGWANGRRCCATGR
jgi:hypothetical protein